MKRKCIELFAGAGGLALGLELAGFKTIGLVEIDHVACQTLKINRPSWNVLETDIKDLVLKDLKQIFNLKEKELDLLSGGYPCQAFSYAGQKRGLDDARGTLFYYYAIFLQKLKPKMFLVENVVGLISHEQGKTLQIMLNVFADIGYNVQWKVLNAWDYNVAQKRKRVFIIGFRNDLKSVINFEFPMINPTKPVLKDVLKNVPLSRGAKYSDAKKEVLRLVPPGGYWKHLPEEIAKKYMKKSYYLKGGRTGIAKRLSWDEPSPTLTCSPMMKQTEKCHPDETRPLTTREYARIQTFPDSWQFKGSMSDIYKQIGNAVPVNLAKSVGKSIIKALDNLP